MLQITIPEIEKYNEESNEFFFTKVQKLRLEHSLVSISKWEAKWHKPFLDSKDKTMEEIIDYVRCMSLTQNVPPEVYGDLTRENLSEIIDYMDEPMTATWFSNHGPTNSRKEIITSEIIYYWMISLNIPFECQKWHLNRLLTLIRVCSVKNEPPKKMSKTALMNRNRTLNDARRAKFKTKG